VGFFFLHPPRATRGAAIVLETSSGDALGTWWRKAKFCYSCFAQCFKIATVTCANMQNTLITTVNLSFLVAETVLKENYKQ